MSDAPHPDIDNLTEQANALQKNAPVQAFALATESLALAQAEGYAHGIAESLYLLASLNERSGNTRTAIQQAQEALARFESLGHTDRMAAAWCIVGWCYYGLAEYSQATQAALHELAIAEADSNFLRQAEAHNLIGSVYSTVEEPENGLLPKTVYHYKQSLAFYEQIGAASNVAVLLNNLCISYEHTDQLDMALEYGLRAVAASRAAGDIYAEALALGNLGIVYRKRGDVKNALHYQQERLMLVRQHQFQMLEAHTLINLGRLSLRMEMPDGLQTAMGYLQAALDLSERIGYKRLIFQCHEELAALYEQQGDLAAALRHFKLHHEIRLAVINEESITQIEQLRVAYDIRALSENLDSERRQREQDRLYYEQMRQLQSDLLNTATHDLKNPLASIFLSLNSLDYLLRQTTEYPRALRILERVMNSANQMKSLIHGLLDKAMIESGRTTTTKPVDLPLYLFSLLEDYRPLATAKHITIRLSCEVQTATFDPDQMRHALGNLLSNAIKYTPSGGNVTLSASKEVGGIILQVCDTGIGIPPEALPYLFTPFYRVPGAQHRAVEGTGLGLSIVKSVIDQHHGVISVESTPAGTCFRVRLPESDQDLGLGTT